ncbi:DUF6207 family protein [Streptomyces sp. NPDC058733]|uniref:DUF6207 family protein n=1 Tax=unclassified Streptomyces TaxID=2593676 RepID=UPI0034561E6E
MRENHDPHVAVPGLAVEVAGADDAAALAVRALPAAGAPLHRRTARVPGRPA